MAVTSFREFPKLGRWISFNRRLVRNTEAQLLTLLLDTYSAQRTRINLAIRKLCGPGNSQHGAINSASTCKSRLSRNPKNVTCNCIFESHCDHNNDNKKDFGYSRTCVTVAACANGCVCIWSYLYTYDVGNMQSSKIYQAQWKSHKF